MTEATVAEYMSRKVVVAKPGQTIREAAEMMVESDHDGLPVVEDGRLLGMVTARDLILHSKKEKIGDVLSGDISFTSPDASIRVVSRFMFRKGISKLPVSENGRLVGIITSSDVIRSHIERATPAKIQKLIDSLQMIHNVKSAVKMGRVEISKLVPTQNKITPEELQARKYELKHGLSEPVVVIERGDGYLLVDGHHRALAAHRTGTKDLNAYIIVMSRRVDLGLEKTAERMGLHSIADISISRELEEGITERVRGEE